MPSLSSRENDGRLITELAQIVDAIAPVASQCSVCKDLEPVQALRRCELSGCFCEGVKFCLGCLQVHTREQLEEIGWNPEYVRRQLDAMGLR